MMEPNQSPTRWFLTMSGSATNPVAVPEPALTLLLVDDHPVLRAGLRSLLSGEPGLEVQADLGSGEEAYGWYRIHRPDVVVMDLAMGGYGGLEALRRIRQLDPDARVLVYTVHASDAMLGRALALGALGFVTKASDSEILIRGIRDVAQRRGFVSPDMVPVLARVHGAQDRPLLEQLGEREFQILLLTGQGHSVDDCARLLNLSDKTVRNYLTQIKAKMNAANTAELVRMAIRAGLVEP